MLSTDDPTIEAVKQVFKELRRPCDKCDGTQYLESVCGGCVEGRAGYKSKWTCNKCLHRELSKKEYMEWLKDLTSSLQNES
jgi:NADH:ubiquinone oxidoreductase subunit F (NADH-binding)